MKSIEKYRYADVHTSISLQASREGLAFTEEAYLQ